MLVCNGFVHRGEVTSIIDSLVTPQLMLLMESVEMAGTIGAQVSVCRCEVCMYTLASTWKKKEQLKRTVYVLLLLMERRVLELSSHVCVCVTRNHRPEDLQHSPVAPNSVGTALSIECTISDDRSSLLMHRSCALPYEVRSYCHQCSSLRQNAILELQISRSRSGSWAAEARTLETRTTCPRVTKRDDVGA